MMRVHKYRGLRTDGGGWAYGDLATPVTTCILGQYEIQTDADNFVVDPATVGQFTGMHDKDGREIYEGDVLSSGYFMPGVFATVLWCDAGLRWMFRWEDDIDGDEGLDDLSRFSDPSNALTITGNIHQPQPEGQPQ